MLSRIMQSLDFVESLMKERYVENSFTVENIMGYVRAAGEFVVMIHIFSCTWLFVGQLQWQWFERDGIDYDSLVHMYIDGIYFVTTTMTSVGYGDFTPNDFRETCYAIVIGAIGATFTAGIIANVTSFFHDVDISDENIDHKLNCVKVRLFEQVM